MISYSIVFCLRPFHSAISTLLTFPVLVHYLLLSLHFPSPLHISLHHISSLPISISISFPPSYLTFFPSSLFTCLCIASLYSYLRYLRIWSRFISLFLPFYPDLFSTFFKSVINFDSTDTISDRYVHNGRYGVRDVVKLDISDDHKNSQIDRRFYITVEPMDMLYPDVVNRGLELPESQRLP